MPVTQHRLPRTPRTLDPIPGHAARDEQVMAMILALTSEMTILRARLDTCERLLAAADILAPGAIEAFTPDAAAETERETLRTRTIAKVLRPLSEGAARDLASITDREARA